MTFRTIFSLSIIVLAAIGCSASEQTASKEGGLVEKEVQPDERISFNINEVIYFEFEKYDTTWTGNFTAYTLNKEDEKVVSEQYVSAEDSSWNDFDLFVNFLNLYQIPPQREIEGWVPDSGELPRRVYSFEVFDGDTTRSYSYQDPIRDIRDYWQVQSLLTFVTFVQNDLRWVEKKNSE